MNIIFSDIFLYFIIDVYMYDIIYSELLISVGYSLLF